MSDITCVTDAKGGEVKLRSTSTQPRNFHRMETDVRAKLSTEFCALPCVWHGQATAQHQSSGDQAVVHGTPSYQCDCLVWLSCQLDQTWLKFCVSHIGARHTPRPSEALVTTITLALTGTDCSSWPELHTTHAKSFNSIAINVKMYRFNRDESVCLPIWISSLVLTCHWLGGGGACNNHPLQTFSIA